MSALGKNVLRSLFHKTDRVFLIHMTDISGYNAIRRLEVMGLSLIL